MPISFALAGTSEHSAQCAQALLDAPGQQFELKYVLTPQPRPVGRQKTLTPSAVAAWTEKLDKKVPIVSLDKKIDTEAKNKVLEQENIDFLLVVDFGFFIPNWLLALPKICPLNIHPSALPKYRGASPGQFSLLYGETDSAVTLMIPNDKMDEGDLLAQLKFSINQGWNQTDYYDHAFNLICQQLPELLTKVASKKIIPQPQPTISPTPPAKILQKSDAFVSWEIIRASILNPEKYFPQEKTDFTDNMNSINLPVAEAENNSTLLLELFNNLPSNLTSAHLLDRAIHAFNPWPLVWTLFPHQNGQLIRLQILDCSYKSQLDKVQLKTIRFEGRPPTSF